jgi:DNA (cytosine-5)-methyltransferase 1
MMRMLQPDELRRAMGFPDSYTFPNVTRRDKVKLMGNAVCSPVMEAIVKSIVVAAAKDRIKKAA